MIRERWRSVATGALILGFAVLLALDHGRARCGAGGPGLGVAAPGFALPTLDGRQVGLAALRGKVVLLDFWATWCASCLRKLPLLEKLRAELGPQGLEVLAINVDGDREATARYATRSGLRLDFALDQRGVAARYGVSALPHVVLVDRGGRVALVQRGGGSFGEMRAKVIAALRKRAAAADQNR